MKKNCELCGKEFQAQGRRKYCNGPHYKKCVVCGKQFQVYNKQEWDMRNCCSQECSNKKRLQTNLENDRNFI